jgi:hypothetical protein
MIYRFKSRATGDLLMQAESAEKILILLNKLPQQPGILLHGEMAQAITTLNQAAKEEADAFEAEQTALQTAEGSMADDIKGLRVSLHQRIVPFVHMLQQCMAESVDVVWGV